MVLKSNVRNSINTSIDVLFSFQTCNQPTPAAATNGPLVNGKADFKAASDMTSKDYYFDSYAHFGIHEVS